MRLVAPWILVASGLALAGCRTTNSKALSDETPPSVVADEDEPAADETPEPDTQIDCPAGRSLVVLGLAPGDKPVKMADLGLPDDELKTDPVPVAGRLPGARFEGCKDRDGQVTLARVYVRYKGTFGETKHFSLVVDPEASAATDDVVTGIQTVTRTAVAGKGITQAFAGVTDDLAVRVAYGDVDFPSALVVRGFGGGIALWVETADGAQGFTVSTGPFYGAVRRADPFAIDAVCPYGWQRAAARYALGRAKIELDACEKTHDLISGEASHDILYRGMRLTDPDAPEYAKGLVFGDEAAVARVLMFQSGDSDGCDDLEVTVPNAEYRLVIGPRGDDCLAEDDPHPQGPKPAGSAGPFTARRGDAPAQGGWAETLPAKVPLTFAGKGSPAASP